MRPLRYGIGVLLTLGWVAPMAAQAPTGTIRGRVTTDSVARPLAGVTVSFGSHRTETREDGQYVLSDVEPGTGTLRVVLIGYTPAARSVTVAAGQTVDVDVTLTARAVNLAEIVVTGYGEQRAGNITGAVTQVTANEFNKGRVISPEELIKSKVAGVQVVDNNEPGGGVSIRIRGPTSVNASSDPLFVIDGVPVGTGAGGGLSAGRNPLNFLNPNDIENITVLKDASAAAIYGSNAANGVVLIQTKSGKKGTQLEYSSTFSSSSVTRLPSMLTAVQFKTAVQQYAPQNVSQLGTANTDWFGQVDRTAFGQEHNLAVSGADDQMSWRLSGGYLKQDGILKGTTTERVSLGANLAQRLFHNRLDVRAYLKGSRAKDLFTPGGVLSNAAQMGPTQPIYDNATTTGYYDWPNNALQSADNPVAILNLASDRGITYRSIGNVQAEYRVPRIEGLRAVANLSYDVTRTDRQTFVPSDLHSELKSGEGGRDYRANQSQSNTGLETYLKYGAPLNLVPGTVDVTGGYSYQWSHAEYPWYQATGLTTDVLGGNGVVSARSTQNFQDIQESRLVSFFGRVNYNYNDRYLLGFSVRRDGSSRFGTGHQWGTFPSVSAGWRISQESFMKDVSAISDLKLRASWAKTGNQAFGNYQQYAAYVLGDAQSQVQFGNGYVATIRPSAVDPNIRWEETRSYDVGLDFGLFDQRITGSFDYYTKNTRDLIFTVPVAAGTNLSNYLTTNIGSMKNHGVELGINALILEGSARKGLSWNTNFSISHNTNELVSINPFGGGTQQILTGLVSGGVGTFIQVLQPGVPVNSFYVYKHKLDANGKPIYSSNDMDMYQDVNGDGKINQDDRVPFHDPAPKWILGHSSYLSYGDFDMSFTLRSYLGAYVYNNVASNLGTYSEVTRASPYNLHASVLQTGFETPQYLSSYYVESGSFLRLDNVSVGYTFKYGRQPVRVFATLQNAFTITGYSGVDPTAGLNGLDNNIYPRARTFTGGLSLRY